ncbi:MAG: arginine--tRNA ligase [Candidatus Thermoplasmatota archaeon]|nr:arginine--tRNA ligase [Candidatus Thermoplasmatota archaeon]
MDYIYFKIQQEIITHITSALKILKYPVQIKLERPPDQGLGDFSFPCFSFSKISRKSPNETAKIIAEKLSTNHFIKNICVDGGYINFSIDETPLIQETVHSILTNKQSYGHLDKKNIFIIVEHTSANPNGPLHIGRARNPIIGDTLTRLLKAAGYSCESQFYLDDLGKQVAILCWGINNLPKEEKASIANKKLDHIAVGFYQKANDLMNEDPQVKQDIQDIIWKSEHGDIQTISLIQEAYQPVLKGMNESLKRVNITIDTYIPESTFVKDSSVEKVLDILKNTPFCHEEHGAYYLDLESFGIKGRNTKFFITRGDGTSLYATRDIAYHAWKATQADILLNVLGEDHKLESKQVEIGLQLLGIEKIPKTVFYSFVSLPEGKMSTRRNRVVYLDDLIDECVQRAYEEVKKRRADEFSELEMKTIAEKIGTGAVRYNIIKVQPEKDMVFQWEDALNFEGNAAPFIQYAHARASSILSKNETSIKGIEKQIYSKLMHPSEIQLIKKMALFPFVIQEASITYKPHLIASYLFDIASLFNQFYRDCPVLSEPDKELKIARLCLVASAKQVLNNGLCILGIDALEEM